MLGVGGGRALELLAASSNASEGSECPVDWPDDDCVPKVSDLDSGVGACEYGRYPEPMDCIWDGGLSLAKESCCWM